MKYFLFLSLGALGVVYGDIGTSPLYALRECFNPHHGVAPTEANILGVLSLIFWSLVLLISVWYLLIVMRADNEGEGGILALMELVKPAKKKFVYFLVITVGLFGASLLYGDGIITPAISVLSAMEGLTIASPFFEHLVIPLTIGILFILFFLQKKGTAKVGIVFGPITLVWFFTLALLGVISVVENPHIFTAINPIYAVNFFVNNGFHGFVILGSVFLVVTGGEALYADMGHFGRKPIRFVWYVYVLPCLLLNYFGQGALLLREPESISNPFYHLAPEWALYPMVILATLATVIASQAVISGAFSLTQQALQLGYLPRLRIIHTSKDERGQIYIPQLNWLLFIATVILVLQFRNSSNLAAAYGIAVTLTMVITSFLAFFAMRKWRWPVIAAIVVTSIFISFDLSFFIANSLKLLHGGWVPLVLGIAVYFIMTTWNWGRKNLLQKIEEQTQPIERFIDEVMSTRVVTTPGTAIYMSSNPKGTPPALVKNLKHNRILHKQIIVLSIIYQKIPRVNTAETIEIVNPTEGFYRVVAYYGFMDKANISQILEILNKNGLNIKMEKTTFFLGRELLVVKDKVGFNRFRKKIFALLSRNSQRATEFFDIPTDRVFEVGSQIEI
ncbi:MAG TPA: potassium transporter Kup [Ignavibacteria bacterium]|nr:potassium transporter Kup [Ignavibacteria bacterium]HRJ04078.1 potassium transporter Kup [Ignavibacteria bacterium]HRJ85620.1 potassium transporter Kup [Ignavibacteria bacterium]